MRIDENKGGPGRPPLTARFHNNSTSEQQQRLLRHLKEHGSVTTFVARRHLEILHPAGRVLELRRRGHRIVTVRVLRYTEFHKPHYVAKYILSSQGSAHGQT